MNQKRMLKNFIAYLTTLLILGGVAPIASAWSLGEPQVNSRIGEPLQVVVPIRDADGLDVQAGIADFAAYDAARIDPAAFAYDVDAEVFDGVNGPAIRFTTRQPVFEPAVVFLAEVGVAGESEVREVGFILDSTLPVVEVQPQNRVVTDVANIFGTPVINRAGPAFWSSTYGPVVKNETAYRIADELRTKAPLELTNPQILAGLVRENPIAFHNGNMNGLIEGAMLSIPSPEFVRGLSPNDALVLFNDQLLQWRGESVAETTRETVTEPTSTPIRADTSAVEADLAQRIKEERAFRDELLSRNEEMRGRLAKLDTDLVELREEIALNTNQLARLRAEVSNIGTTPVAVAEAATPAVGGDERSPAGSPAGDAIAPVDDVIANNEADAQSEFVDESQNNEAVTTVERVVTDTISAVGTDVVESVPSLGDGAEAVGTAVTDAVDQATGESPGDDGASSAEIDNVGVSDTVSAIDETIPSTDVASASDGLADGESADTSPPVTLPILGDNATESTSDAAKPKVPLPLGNGRLKEGIWERIPLEVMLALAFLAIVAVIVMRWQRARVHRQLEQIKFDEKEAGLRSEVSAKAARTVELEEAEAEPLDEERHELEHSADLDEGDGLEQEEDELLREVDVYRAYGRFDQAAEMLRHAIDQDPWRVDLRARLAEIHHENGEVHDFLMIARGLYLRLRQVEDVATWDRLCALGRESMPKEKLFQRGLLDEEPEGPKHLDLPDELAQRRSVG
ncbi:MAG: FimV/HubP family polar landmark protein [Pseudomonadota bacterium]